jgi:hypothetical protein
MGYDAARATSIGKSWESHVGTQELYATKVLFNWITVVLELVMLFL